MQKAMGQFEEGIRNCTESLELNPMYVKVLLRRGGRVFFRLLVMNGFLEDPI